MPKLSFLRIDFLSSINLGFLSPHSNLKTLALRYLNEESIKKLTLEAKNLKNLSSLILHKCDLNSTGDLIVIIKNLTYLKKLYLKSRDVNLTNFHELTPFLAKISILGIHESLFDIVLNNEKYLTNLHQCNIYFENIGTRAIILSAYTIYEVDIKIEEYRDRYSNL